MPNIGEPLRIETAPQNEPMITGAPGRTSCASAIPAIVSARISAMHPATVTGPIAPASTAGTMMQPWLRDANARSDPSMRPSKVNGEFELMLPSSTGWVSRWPSPNRMSAMAIASAACPGVSGVPSQGWSLQRKAAYWMSRCRLLGGRSIGSQALMPVKCRAGAICVSFTRFTTSSMVP